MIRVLVDSNVLVDYLAQRPGFYEEARKLLIFADMGDYELWMSSSQATDLFYILSNGGRRSQAEAARSSLRALRQIVRVCAPTEREVDLALDSPWEDFEDALVCCCAQSIDARAIVTRNTRDFSRSLIPALSPTEFFPWMKERHHRAYEEITF